MTTDRQPQSESDQAPWSGQADPDVVLAPFGLRVGATLARKYQIEGILGTGGMGVVVLAVHLGLHQRVAIKLVQPELARDPQLVERFMREARAAAQLRTDHVVRIFDVDARDDGTPYMVMECLDGSDLGAILAVRGRLPIAESVNYLLQTCAALEEAHERGIVHRDLKLSNLFLVRSFTGPPMVKLLDFGIAKVARSEPVSILTGTSMSMGSPQHMSPEQFRDSRSVDHRTDIWSLGTIGFQMLIGHPPFTADTLTALVAQIAADPAPRMIPLRPDVPVALEAALLRCLEKAPEQRFQTVSELVEALLPFASTGTTLTTTGLRPGGTRAPSRAPSRVSLTSTPSGGSNLAVAAVGSGRNSISSSSGVHGRGSSSTAGMVGVAGTTDAQLSALRRRPVTRLGAGAVLAVLALVAVLAVWRDGEAVSADSTMTTAVIHATLPGQGSSEVPVLAEPVSSGRTVEVLPVSESDASAYSSSSPSAEPFGSALPVASAPRRFRDPRQRNPWPLPKKPTPASTSIPARDPSIFDSRQ